MKLLKIILFIVAIVFLVHGLGFAQPAHSDSTKVEKKLTAADSTITDYEFSKSTQEDLTQIEEQLRKITEAYQELSKERTIRLETAYKVICDQKGIDRKKATVKKVDNKTIKIQVRK